MTSFLSHLVLSRSRYVRDRVCRARTRLHTSGPVIPGMTQSRMATSGGVADSSLRIAASPSSTASTSWPNLVNKAVSRRRMSASSSATRIFIVGHATGGPKSSQSMRAERRVAQENCSENSELPFRVRPCLLIQRARMRGQPALMNVNLGIWDKLSKLMVFLLFVAGLLIVFFWYLPLIQ